MRKILFILLFPSLINAQNNIVKSILLDSIIISEVKSGFSVNEFISYVKNDTSFYHGFKNLRYYEHDFKSNLDVYDNKNKYVGNVNLTGKYKRINDKLIVEREIYNTEGKIKNKRGKYRYYTPRFFEKIFYPVDTLKVSKKISNKKIGEDKRETDAKAIIFSPGSDNLEHGGNQKKKFAIFDEKMQNYYDFSISHSFYKDSIDCYVFKCEMKDSLNPKEIKEVIIKKLVSYFDKKTFNVVHRVYQLKFDHLIIDLDVTVNVEMGYIDEILVPLKIEYKGNWDIPFSKREISNFKMTNYNFKIKR